MDFAAWNEVHVTRFQQNFLCLRKRPAAVVAVKNAKPHVISNATILDIPTGRTHPLVSTDKDKFNDPQPCADCLIIRYGWKCGIGFR